MMATNMEFSALAEAVIAANIGRDGSLRTRIEFWIGHFDRTPVTEITADSIEDGVDLLVKRGKIKVTKTKAGIVRTPTGEPLSPASINRFVAALGSVFREARRMRLLPRGFTSPMRGVQRHQEGPGRTLSVTLDDVRRLISVARVSRNRKLAALIAVACTTGWRLGAIQALKWGDVDLSAGFIDTPRTKNGTPHRAPLMPFVVAELKAIRPSSAAIGDPVFGSHSFEKAFASALKRADLPVDWTFHHCRHIAASILAQSGASTVTIMAALNHKTPMMAMRYSHLNVDSLRTAVGKAWS